jgi:hypothetical protein
MHCFWTRSTNSPEVQAKLLRVSEQGRFERLGSTRPRQVNVRIIAASNRMIVSKGQILNISIPRSTASNFSTNQYADK